MRKSLKSQESSEDHEIFTFDDMKKIRQYLKRIRQSMGNLEKASIIVQEARGKFENIFVRYEHLLPQNAKELFALMRFVRTEIEAATEKDFLSESKIFAAQSDVTEE